LFVDKINDEINEGLLIESDTTFSLDVTIEGGQLYGEPGLTINPNQGDSGILRLGENGENDEIHIDGILTVTGDLTVGGLLYGNSAITGTIADSFTIDSDDSTNTPTLAFRDSDGDEYLRWNDLVGSFQLSDDLSLGGNLTVEKELRVEASGGRSVFSGTDHTLEISDGNIEIFSSSESFTVSSGFDDDGDLAVADDVEVGGDLSLGGDVTIAGVIFSDDYTQIMGNLTAMGDLDVRGRILDGIGPDVDILDNLSVSEDLTIWGSDIYLGLDDLVNDVISFAGNTEQFFWDESLNRFSFTDDVQSSGTFLFGGDTGATPVYNAIASSQPTPSGIMDSSDDLYVQGDVEVGGDLSLGGDVTIIGVIFSDDYTQVTGNLTVTGDLDVRGKIFDGIGTDVDILDNLSVSGDLTVGGADLYIGYDDSVDDILHFAQDTERLFWDEAGDEFEITDDFFIPGTLTTSGGAVIGDDIGDIFALTSSGLNIRQDGVIRDTDSEVEVGDDLLVSGDLTILGSTRLGDSTADNFILISSGINIDVDGEISDTDSAVTVDDDLSVSGELSVADELEVHGSGVSRFSQGMLYIGTRDGSDLTDDAGDLYVENDVEIGVDLSVGGDVTIAGQLSVGGGVFVTSIDGVG